MDEIHVCFSISDRKGDYSKYLGTAIISLLEKTSQLVCIHIIHDDTLSKRNIEKFKLIGKKYNSKIVFYKLNLSALRRFEKQVGFLTLGTLFRFFLADILPRDVGRVVYLDDDIVVNLDIKELWNVNLEKFFIAACHDPGVFSQQVEPAPCADGSITLYEYFNAGVLLLNLNKIRRMKNFSQKCIDILRTNSHYTLLDQDVFNVMFNGKVKYLPDCYNYFSRYIRKKVKEEKCICHFSGDSVKINSTYWIDQLFMSYLKKSPWGATEDFYSYVYQFITYQDKKIHTIHRFVKVILSKNTKVIIWGVESKLCNKLNMEWKLKDIIYAYIDSNEKLEGKLIEGKKVYSPKLLKKADESFFVVVASIRYYDEIKENLEELGFVEKKDFIDARLLVEFD